MNRIDIDTLKSWTGTDADLARHCGVTRQAIHHARLTHGIPAPINGRVGPRHGLGRTLCTAVIREATRRAGSLADDAVRRDAIRAVLDDLNEWHKGETIKYARDKEAPMRPENDPAYETCPQCGRVDLDAHMCWRVGHLPRRDIATTEQVVRDLLAALEAAHGYLVIFGTDHGDRIRSVCRAAIAKATKEKP